MLKHGDEKQPVEEAVHIVRVQHGGKAWKQTAWQQDQGTRDHVRKQNKWEMDNCINSQAQPRPPMMSIHQQGHTSGRFCDIPQAMSPAGCHMFKDLTLKWIFLIQTITSHSLVPKGSWPYHNAICI